jgi:hypothetical protein
MTLQILPRIAELEVRASHFVDYLGQVEQNAPAAGLVPIPRQSASGIVTQEPLRPDAHISAK